MKYGHKGKFIPKIDDFLEISFCISEAVISAFFLFFRNFYS